MSRLRRGKAPSLELQAAGGPRPVLSPSQPSPTSRWLWPWPGAPASRGARPGPRAGLTLAPSLPGAPLAPRGPAGPGGPCTPRSPGKPLSPWKRRTGHVMAARETGPGVGHLGGNSVTYSGSRGAGGTKISRNTLRGREGQTVSTPPTLESIPVLLLGAGPWGLSLETSPSHDLNWDAFSTSPGDVSKTALSSNSGLRECQKYPCSSKKKVVQTGSHAETSRSYHAAVQRPASLCVAPFMKEVLWGGGLTLILAEGYLISRED